MYVNFTFAKWASAWDFQQCGMCDQQSLRSGCAYTQSDQSLCFCLNILWLLSYWPNIIWSFYALKEAVQARLSLHLSTYHIFGNQGSNVAYWYQFFTWCEIYEVWNLQFNRAHSLDEVHLVFHCSFLNRGSYMSAHVLLNLLNELGKIDKMRGLPSILSLFWNEFNKFNNTRARMLDSIYHMTNTLKSHFWHKT